MRHCLRGCLCSRKIAAIHVGRMAAWQPRLRLKEMTMILRPFLATATISMMYSRDSGNPAATNHLKRDIMHCTSGKCLTNDVALEQAISQKRWIVRDLPFYFARVLQIFAGCEPGRMHRQRRYQAAMAAEQLVLPHLLPMLTSPVQQQQHNDQIL